MKVNRPLLVVALVAGLVAGWWATGHDSFTDLHVYRYGGQLILDGGDLYAPRDGLPFTYTPFSALLMAPLALPPTFVVAALWAAATIYCLGAVADLVVGSRLAGLSAKRRDLAIAAISVAALALEPVRSNLGFAQVNVFLMLGILYDLLRPQRRLSGIWIGVAAGVKLTPLSFVFFLLLVRRSRTAAVAVGAFVATVAIGFIARPGSSSEYWTEVLWDPNRVGGVAYAGNQSVLGAMTRLLGEEPGTGVWFAVAGVLTLAVMVIGALWWRAGQVELGACLAAAGMLVASPISWDHHFVWVFPFTIVLLGLARSWAARSGVLAFAAIYASGMIWWPPNHDDREVLWSAGEQVIGNAFLGALLLLVAALAVALRRRTVTASDEPREAATWTTTPAARQTAVDSSGQRSK